MQSTDHSSFEKSSYQSHENWFAKQYPEDSNRTQLIKKWENGIAINSIEYWIHKQLFNLADPLVKNDETWLTVGDGYGFDANYFVKKGCKVTATDIGDAFLPISKAQGMIESYSIENVEKLSFQDNSFDYAFCKESYHHFPRAYLGVYEMLRVAKKGIILIEPQDPLTKMPLMLALKNILDRINPYILQKYWKNRYSFEEVGNYVFKLSEREMEKIAMGLNLPSIAFKGINNLKWRKGFDAEKAVSKNPIFKTMIRKLKLTDFLCKIGFIPYEVLSAIIFKEVPSESTINALNAAGYLYYEFPKNPYL